MLLRNESITLLLLSSSKRQLALRLGPQDVDHEGVPTRGRELSLPVCLRLLGTQ